MKTIATLTAVLTLSLAMSTDIIAADGPPAPDRNVSPNVLSALGLSGLGTLSDQQGLTIRGRAVIGDPTTGIFTTVGSGPAKTGLIDHNLKAHTTTIVLHPQKGSFTVPPLKK